MFIRFPHEQWKRNQIAIILAASIIFTSFTFVMPFLPFFVSSLGIKGKAVAVWSGIVLSISPFLAAILGPFWGRAADRYGMKIMLTRVLIAMTVHWFLMIFVWNVYSLLALRTLLGLFSGFNAMSIALITHGCPKEKIGRSIGTLQFFQILSVGVGPFVGGILYDSIGLRFTFGITSTFCFISLALIILLYKDIPFTSASDSVTESDVSASASPTHNKHLSFTEILRLPGIFSLMILLFFANLVSRSFSTITPLFVEILSTTKQNLGFISGIIVSFSSFAEAISAFVFGHLAARILPRKLIVLSLTGGAIAILPMAFVQSEYQFLILRILSGLLSGGTLTLAFTTGEALLPSQSRVASYAILSSTALLGGALGPLLSGIIAATDIRVTFPVAAALYLFLIWNTMAGIRKERIVKAQEIESEKMAETKPYIPLPRL